VVLEIPWDRRPLPHERDREADRRVLEDRLTALGIDLPIGA
jgi:hypothetical protein